MDLAIHLLSFVLVLRYQGARVQIQSSKKAGQCVEYPKTRHFPRIQLQVPVFLRGTDTSGVDFVELTKTLNISATGACIASAHILRPDQIVQLTIPSPSPATPGLVPSETPPIPARVRRQDVVGETRLFAVEFLRSLE
jgi:PilZ domain-containing protein